MHETIDEPAPICLSRPMLNFCKAIVLLLVLVHIITLTKSPIPWFDETYFASLSLSLSEGNGFEAPVSPLLEVHNPQAKAYGPGYMLLNATVFKIFGFGIFQNRMLGLLSGFLSIWVFWLFAARAGIDKAWRWPIMACLLADPIFAQSMHSGRMDSMAVLCMISVAFMSYKMLESSAWKWVVLAGLLSGFCLLVSPRPAFLLVAFWAAYVLVCLFQMRFRIVGMAATIALIAGCMYLLWIYFGFGGFQPWADYFFAPSADPVSPKKSNLFAMYVGGHGFVPSYQYFILVPALLAVLLSFKHWQKPVLFGLLAAIASFYLFITDTGMYSALIILFWYFLLFQSLYLLQTQQVSAGWKTRFGYIRYAFLTFCLGLFSVKMLFILITLNDRSHSDLQQFVAQHIPPNSRVIGDDAYYYAVLKAGSDFQYLIRGSHGPRRRQYHLDEYRFQYLVVSEQAGRNTTNAQKYYGEKVDWKKIASFRAPEQNSNIQALILIYRKNFRTLAYSFNADIYVPVKRQEL